MSRARDEERVGRIKNALAAKRLDALVCTLPSNVLMLSGYWPVLGTAIAIATREGMIAVIAPEDEHELALHSWADVVRTFKVGALTQVQTVMEAVSEPLKHLQHALGFCLGTRVGFEGVSSLDPCGYASKFLYGAGVEKLLGASFPFAVAEDASDDIAQLRSALTSQEIQSVRKACGIARNAFCDAAAAIAPGMREFELAALLRSGLAASDNEAVRCDGFAYCMSGSNSARAYAAYQQSGSRVLAAGDNVLLHCNSYCEGYWTDITRTYFLGEPTPETNTLINAVLEAGSQAFKSVRPGISASRVDDAARHALGRRGFVNSFKHATGHGVGFAAIDHNARPRIHPLSDEMLEPGMVFNIEPAIYLDNLGIRQCDMVVVTEDAMELLTPFHQTRQDLVVELA
jgi:Xaa-Pro aminopeptidase